MSAGPTPTFDRLQPALFGGLLGGIVGALLGMAIGAIFFAPPEPVNPEVNTAFCGILGIMQKTLVIMAISLGLLIGGSCGTAIGAVAAVQMKRARLTREAQEAVAKITPDPTGIEFTDTRPPP